MEKHGRKSKAGKLLSRFLETIAEEKTELVKDPKTGEDRIATKAEALARMIWRDALGWTERDTKNEIDIVHLPNQNRIATVFNRIEGKAPVAGEDTADKLTAADRVTEVGKSRIAEAGGMENEG